MLICLNLYTGTGCGAQNRNGAKFCQHCGKPLRLTLQLHDPTTRVGRYRIVQMIGHGGFGAVYEAIDEQSGRRVALKETLDSKHIRSFQGELAILRALQHVHLPRYYEMFEAQGRGYLVMEFVPGQNLAKVLNRKQGPLLESQVVGFALQLCDALSYLHNQTPPILHRDIKPANILLTPGGLIKLVDFGLLKVGEATTRSTRRGFTPPYAPPEQWHGGTEQRSDVYSLGATLYHLLTATEPKSAPIRGTTFPDPLAPPQQLNPNLSPHIAETIMTAMALHQGKRYRDVATMKQALMGQKVAVNEPTTKPTTTFVVSQTGGGYCKTISEAIQNAQAGSQIVVRPGRYTESLIIDKPLIISGDGPVEDIIVESRDASCLRMQADNAQVRGLTLRGCVGSEAKPFYAVDIPQGDSLLEDCHITSESLACVAIHGADANPTIRDCKIHDGQAGGVFVYDKGQGTIEACDIFGNTYSGIVITQGGNPHVRKCRIYDGKANGVYLYDKGEGTIEECEIFGNALAGVAIKEEANPVIRKCQIHSQHKSGIRVYKNGQATVEECDIEANALAGVMIKSGGKPIIRHCKINRNNFYAIQVDQNGAARVENCDLTANGRGAWQIDSHGKVESLGNKE